MRLLIICLLFSSVAFGQKDTTYVDSISLKDFSMYLERINTVVKKQFDLSDESYNKYQLILKELQSVYQDARRKKK